MITAMEKVSKKGFFVYFFSLAMLFVGHGLQMTLIPLEAQARGFEKTTIALIVTLSFFGFLVGTLVGPQIIKRIGYKPTFLMGTSMLALLALLLTLNINTTSMWIVTRTLAGFYMATLYVTVEGWLHDTVSNAVRGRMMGIYLFVNFFFMMLGTFLVNLDKKSLNLPLLTIALFMLLAFAVMLCIRRTPSVSVQTFSFSKLFNHGKQILKRAPFGFAGVFIMGFTTAPFWELGSLFAKGSAAPLIVPIFMSATILGGALGQWPFGSISDRFGRPFALFLLAILGVLSTLALSILTFAHVVYVAPFYVLGFIYGFVTFPLFGVASSHVFDVLRHQGRTTSGMAGYLLFIYAIGGTLASFFNSTLIALLHTMNVIFMPGLIANFVLVISFVITSLVTRKTKTSSLGQI